MTPPDPPSGGGGGSAGPSAPPWLKARTFGMPRYVFVGLIVAAIGVGLYLRSRTTAADTAEEAADEEAVPSEEFSATGEDFASMYAGDPSVLPGGAAGQVIPVTSPVIPEGFPEVFAGLGQLSTDLGGYLGEQQKPNITIVNKPKPPRKGNKPGKQPKKPQGGKKPKKQKPNKHAAAVPLAPATGGHWQPGHWANPNDKKHSHWVPAKWVPA